MTTDPHQLGAALDALLTKPEAARYLRVSLSTVNRLIRDEELDVVKLGGSVRITERALRDLADRRTTRAADNRPKGQR